jgi:hypothetical protein
MSLTAPRFAGEPTLEACLAGTHRMLAPESGPAVRKVQEALFDLGFSQQRPDSQFGTLTGDAVVAYKTDHNIFQNDPVVGPKTMAALDADCVDKPPAPFSDRDEFVSWRDRASVPRVGAFDFTRADELARRIAGQPFTFDAESGWLPGPLQLALMQSLSAFLDPFGSPLGPGQDPATWGVGPFDLYHYHLVLDTQGGLAPPVLLNASALTVQMVALRTAALAVPGAALANAIFSTELRRLLLASGLLPQFAALAIDGMNVATVAQPLIAVWHSFEHPPRWRPTAMTSASLQRHWQTQVAPTPTLPTTSFFQHATLGNFTHNLFQVSFYVSKAGVITAMQHGGPHV